jgi:hypothetical protein
MIMEATTEAMTLEELQASVRQLLKWSEEQYCTFLFETGLAYLEAYFQQDQQAIDLLKVKREFWNWFKNHWQYRDQIFFESFLQEDAPLHLKRELYTSLHCPDILACEIYPSKIVLGHNFSIIKIQTA